jgi:uncharacterized Tic20 family protein
MARRAPATEEIIWAVLSHLSALTLGMGILLPLVGWSDQRRKSNYASFQSLQALGYQSLGYTVWVLLTLLIILVMLFGMVFALGVGAKADESIESVAGIWMISIFIVMMLSLGVYILFPVIAAVACALGKEFHYPVLGRRLAKYLNYGPGNEVRLNEDHEEHWVAGMGHFSVVIMIWGMLVPLTAWILQGNRSRFLKFQTIQTLLFQSGTMMLYFCAAIIYMIGFVALITTTGLVGNSGIDSSGGMFAFAVIIGASLLAFVIIMLIPFLHILGQWAGYRVLKGDDYHYPLLGRFVQRRIDDHSNMERKRHDENPDRS